MAAGCSGTYAWRKWRYLVQQDPAGFADEMLSKARHAVAACESSVPRVHVVNGKADEGLLAEVFRNGGIGTLVHANEYQQILSAKKKDASAIQALARQAV